MEKFPGAGFTKINGKQEQIAIGEVKELDTHVEVEVLPGCSKVALMDAMQKIANEKGKTVKAEYNDEKIVAEPEEK